MTPVGAYQAAGSAYQSQAVGTAGPAQLVLMLYDGALAAIAKAERAMTGASSDGIEVINLELTRAQDIVTELMLSLDHERGGGIAGNLAAIYTYCIETLTKANMAKDPAPLVGVSKHLADLRGAFAAAAAQVAAGAA
jgi:flagellar protein FliS